MQEISFFNAIQTAGSIDYLLNSKQSPHALQQQRKTLIRFVQELLTDPNFFDLTTNMNGITILMASHSPDIVFLTFSHYIQNNIIHPNMLVSFKVIFSSSFIGYIAINVHRALPSVLEIQKLYRNELKLPFLVSTIRYSDAIRSAYSDYIVQFFTYFHPTAFGEDGRWNFKHDYCNTLLEAYVGNRTPINNAQWIELFGTMPQEYIYDFLDTLRLQHPNLINEVSEKLAAFPFFCAESFKLGFQPVLLHCDIPKLAEEYPDLFCS